MAIIGLTLLASLVVLAAWNVVTNLQLLKLRRLKQVELPDSKYYELKYKMQFMVAMFTVFVAIASFYGYTLEGTKQRIEGDLDSLNRKILRSSKQVDAKDSLSRDIAFRYVQMSNQFMSLSKKIQTINEKNILKQNYYVVSSLLLKVSDKPMQLYFKDLITNNGDKLPVFKSPPLVIPASEGGEVIEVGNVTKDSFLVGYGSFFEGSFVVEGKVIKDSNFNLLIIEK